jgi:hypothetical protein
VLFVMPLGIPTAGPEFVRPFTDLLFHVVIHGDSPIRRTSFRANAHMVNEGLMPPSLHKEPFIPLARPRAFSASRRR